MMWSRTFVHNHMKSVVCYAPKTVSGNLYVIFRLWNHGPTLLHRILVCSLHTLKQFWVESSLYASWTLISWLIKSLQTCYDHQRMAKPGWQDPPGLETINIIVKKLILWWMNRLHTVQLKLISAILDGQDILCCTATSNGKSAAFSIPCLMLLEYNQHPESYPTNLPIHLRPIGVMVTPTKGLASNIICLPFCTLSVTNIFLGERTFETQHLCFLLLPWNPQQGVKGWRSFGVRDHGMC